MPTAPHLRRALGLAALTAAPAVAQDGEGFRYDYLELEYRQLSSVEGTNADPDGIGIVTSFELSDQWRFLARFWEASGSAGAMDLEYDHYQLGVGYYVPLSETADVVFDMAWVNADVGAPVPMNSESGYRASSRFRVRASDAVEINADLAFQDVGDAGEEIQFGFDVIWSTSEDFALGAAFVGGEDYDAFVLHGRFYM